MANPGATLLARIAGIVGGAHVLSAPADIEPFLEDWRGRFHGAARAVVKPGSTDEVAAVVRVCAENGISVVPQGGNTGLCGGAVPDDSGDEILVSLVRMNRVRALDAANATITVEAGMPLAAVQDAATAAGLHFPLSLASEGSCTIGGNLSTNAGGTAVQEAATAAGLHFPLSLASEGSCTIGGNLSTNAGGTAVLRYGNTRELTLGVEAVLADGSIFSALRGLRKDNTGYDLKQLFIGAEGTLGIITAAVLKLFPAPRTRVTAFAAVGSVEGAIDLLRRLQAALSDRLTGFELMSAFSLALSRKHHPGVPDPLPGHPWYTLVQADDGAANAPLPALIEAALAAAVEAGVVADAVVAHSGEQAARLWALRENISEAQRHEGPNIKHDISLPVSAIPPFMRECAVALGEAFPGARLVVFGHLGDGNLHYNLSAPEAVEARDFMDNAAHANRIVHDLVARHGGSFSAEHGVGQLKRDELVRYKSPVELRMMRAVKLALDPLGLMNPGKVL